MDLIDLELVEFRRGKKAYIYSFACRTKFFLLRKYIKFTVKSSAPNMTWARVMLLMKQHNMYLHDLERNNQLHLGELTISMDAFNALDIDSFGKDPIEWAEMREEAFEKQKALCERLRVQQA